MEIKLTKEQVQNLEVFLARVDLKGNEVPAFVEIVNAINNAKVKKDEKES